MCHGALFRLADGVPVEGPAVDPVRVFAVRVREGAVEVDL
jgi:nitrite reductase/ring-hydroxylating ferredoxin subunit